MHDCEAFDLPRFMTADCICKVQHRLGTPLPLLIVGGCSPQDVLVCGSMETGKNGIPSGTVGDVLPGSLLGPILGLAFSTDGDLLFAGSGSSISTYDVRSGAVLSTARVFTPGVAVCGIDVGRESCEFVGGVNHESAELSEGINQHSNIRFFVVCTGWQPRSPTGHDIYEIGVSFLRWC